MCSCDEEETPPSMEPPRCMLRLRSTVGAEEVDMKWRRVDGQPRPFSDDRPGAVFVFGDGDQTSGTGLSHTRVSL